MYLKHLKVMFTAEGGEWALALIKEGQQLKSTKLHKSTKKN